ncbi:MAG: peptidase C15 [Cyanobacteriota bacterium]|nr:peptidase C15 [Cyanobacteriota bacterium]
MHPKLLLTSFETWLPHQKSNTSDDLLGKVSRLESFSPTRTLLRKLPVDNKLATDRTIAAIEQLQPTGILCCGMAEKRSRLTLESQATRGEEILPTTVDLDTLLPKLAVTEISHDAGDFVCNHLYYTLLEYLHDRNSNIPCLFVHVPLLDANNLAPIVDDFTIVCREIEKFDRA